MIGFMEKEYWLVMVVVKCLFAEGVSGGNLVGMKIGEVVFERYLGRKRSCMNLLLWW